VSAQAEGAQRSKALEETPTIRQLALAYSADELMPHPLPEEDRASGVPVWQLTTDVEVQAEVYERLDRSLYEDEGSSSSFARMQLPHRKGRHAFSVGIGGNLVDVEVQGLRVELRQGDVSIAEAYWGERTIVAGTRSLGQPCSGTGVRAEAAPQAEMVYQLLDTFLARFE
jgi:hypothetical protein